LSYFTLFHPRPAHADEIGPHLRAALDGFLGLERGDATRPVSAPETSRRIRAGGCGA